MKEGAYILAAIPFFGLFIGLEIYADSRRGWRHYKNLKDSVSNLYIGLGEVLLSLVIKSAMIFLYEVVLRNTSIFRIPDNLWTGILFFFLFDFIYYWAHRLGHEINFMWAGHVAHHSSEAFNLTVALRQPWFQVVTTMFLFLPLAILGFSTRLLVIVSALDILYQFWIHTPYIGKMPRWFEFIFNTPSHHRVHHGRQKKYLDKNHGGVLIIWDRLFGTFQEEEETPDYGITQPLHSFSPFRANFHHFGAIVRALPRAYASGKVSAAFLASPAAFNQHFPDTNSAPSPSENAWASKSMGAFIIWHLVHALIQGIWLMGNASALPQNYVLMTLGFLMAHIAGAGFILDKKPIARIWENFRLTGVMVLGSALLIFRPELPLPGSFWAGVYLIAFAMVSWAWFQASSKPRLA